MASSRSHRALGLAALAVATAVLTVFVLPPSVKQPLLASIPGASSFAASGINLGLDLQGGTQLSFKLDMAEIAARNSDETKDNDISVPEAVNGVMNILERRVNSLGVAEANIFSAQFGEEQQVFVELPGVKDIADAKARVGRVTKLAFKEANTDADNNLKGSQYQAAGKLLLAAEKDGLTAATEAARAEGAKLTSSSVKAASGSKLSGAVGNALLEAADNNQKLVPIVIEDVNAKTYHVLNITDVRQERTTSPDYLPGLADIAPAGSDTGRDTYLDSQLAEMFPAKVAEAAAKLSSGEISPIVTADSGDQYILYAFSRLPKATEMFRASHILFAKQDLKPEPAATATQEEKDKVKAENEQIARDNADALASARNVITLLNASADVPADFAQQARDAKGDATAANGGDLGYFSAEQMVQPFADAVKALEVGKYSTEPVETQFGYHIVLKTGEKPAGEGAVELAWMKVPAGTDAQAAYDTLTMRRVIDYDDVAFSYAGANWKEAVVDGVALTGEHLTRASLQFSQVGEPLVVLSFNNTGARLFGEITRRNIGQGVAIFLDDEPILRRPAGCGGTSGIPCQDYAPTIQEAILGGSAQITGFANLAEAQELVQNLNDGSLPVSISLAGENTIGSLIGEGALKQAILAGAAGLIALMLFMMAYYRLPGVVAAVALFAYTVFMLSLMQLFSVTLSLAGIAGLILSIGLAVDANVLIFERMKEELARGKPLAQAIDVGFTQAWTAIRDSNLTSLFTALILFWFGSSIIRGFGLTLSIGIVVSILTAVYISRQLLLALAGTGLGRKLSWWRPLR